MSEYIKREEVLALSYCPISLTMDNPLSEQKEVVDIRDIEAIPTADVEEVKHGEWIPTDIEQEFSGCIDEVIIYKCSLCGRYEDKQEPYCNCGAKMDEKKD